MEYRNAGLILASGSPRRKELLEMTGHLLEIIPSSADETTDETAPDKLVEELSSRKASDAAGKIKDGIVLGADTVVSIDGTILGKPEDEQDAERMLKMLSGRTHQVFTGVTLISVKNGKIEWSETFSEKTDVTVIPMTDEEIGEYVMSREPLDKAGAYGIQGFFGKYISRIEGDYFNVVGLPLSHVYQALRRRDEDAMQ